jgi:hypothetical protein
MLIEFRDSAGNCLTPDVEGDLLSGTTQPCGTAIQNPDGRLCHCSKPEEGLKRGTSILEGSKLEGSKLVGAVLTLRGREDYELQIANVTETPFWADCKDQYCAKTFPRYDFVATRIRDHCMVQVCAPGLDDQEQPGSIFGTAVIFRGELYDDQHRVTTQTPGNPDDDVFNIACMGTAISKLHLLRHTTASQAVKIPQKTSPQTITPQTTTLQKRAQAMLRLLTADYCGNGSAFTRDDLPIKLGFNDKAWQLLDVSKYNYNTSIGVNTSGTVDALWTDTGATCVGMPRYTKLTIDGIKAICMSDNPALKGCADDDIKPPVNFTKLYALGNYAISGNPPAQIPSTQ